MKQRTVIFIRHGQTAGNREKRYIGRTDQPLCAEGREALSHRNYPPCETVISSPMTRCLQTARIIYPDIPLTVHDGLRECDFGDFEGRNYKEMQDDPAYTAWVDSGGQLPFPHGEAHDAFKRRCVNAFASLMANHNTSTVSFVVHGGTIMAILEAFARPRGTFYDYQVKNGGGFVTLWDGETLTVLQSL